MEHLDVVIVGGGLSGVGAAVHVQRDAPWATWTVLEAREALGGTWDLFRYPGVRSDSDMFTLGYSFKPWTGTRGIVDGSSIREYVQEAADENGVTPQVRFRHRVTRAEWSSDQARWTLTVETAAGVQQMTCGFLLSCTGYYRYDAGHTPDLPGREDYRGAVLHPQAWPQDLDLDGKRVAVLGSGATAMTLVPSLAPRCEHVVMVQRTPTYVAARPQHDLLARLLDGRLPARAASSAVRWKNVLLTRYSYRMSKAKPERMKKLVRLGLRRELPGFDLDTHFTPPYDPWDQRFCVVPDGDLFRCLRDGSASVVTGRTAGFTPTGLRLEDGREVEADVVVTATGLQLLALGGLEVIVDGEKKQVSDCVSYRGAMLSGIPNLVVVLGYTNASWTLKCELALRWTTRLLQRMRRERADAVVPVWPEPELPEAGLIDLTSGYVQRSLDQFPRSGSTPPWTVHQDFLKDQFVFRWGRDLHRDLRFSRATAPTG